MDTKMYGLKKVVHQGNVNLHNLKLKGKQNRRIFFSFHKQLTFQSGFQSFRLPVDKISDKI